MKPEDIQPAVAEAFCIFSSLRKLHFPSDDIFIIFYGKDVIVELSNKYTSKIDPKRKLAFRAGDVDDVERARRTVTDFCRLPDRERLDILSVLLPHSNVMRDSIKLLGALMAHGVAPWTDEWASEVN